MGCVSSSLWQLSPTPSLHMAVPFLLIEEVKGMQICSGAQKAVGFTVSHPYHSSCGQSSTKCEALHPFGSHCVADRGYWWLGSPVSPNTVLRLAPQRGHWFQHHKQHRIQQLWVINPYWCRARMLQVVSDGGRDHHIPLVSYHPPEVEQCPANRMLIYWVSLLHWVHGAREYSDKQTVTNAAGNNWRNNNNKYKNTKVSPVLCLERWNVRTIVSWFS